MPRSYTNISKHGRVPDYTQENVYWSNQPRQELADIKEVYNHVKRRKEVWYRRSSGHDWQLRHADPGEVWEESFIGPVHAFVALVGLSLDKTWSINGDPAPLATNFVIANQISGGLIMRSLGAAADDWVAMHTGGQYPVAHYVSPHFHFHSWAPDYTNLHIIGGLVGSSNLETANDSAWTQPDNGIWMEYDSDVDTLARFVTRSGGVQQSTPLGTPVGGVEHSTQFYLNDSYDTAICIFDGTIRARHTLHIPTVQLKPLFMTQARTTAQRDRYLLDFKLMWDHF